MKKFVAIGHITNDTEPTPHLGGGVAYAAVAAARLGHEAHIITKCPRNHPYITQLNNYGVAVTVLSSQKQTITTFRNTYTTDGTRTQAVLARQESITIADTDSFPMQQLQDALLFVSPVIDEVAPNLYPLLSQYGQVAVAPQGYFRDIDIHNRVKQKVWSGFEHDLQSVSYVLMSEADITIDGHVDKVLLETITAIAPIVIVTKGEEGSTLFINSTRQDIHAYPIRPNEVKDYTGAGDAYSAAFLIAMANHQNPKQAAISASLYASLKLLGFGGIGIDSLPTKEQTEKYIAKNEKRVADFFAVNHTEPFSLFASQKKKASRTDASSRQK